jgi:predicted lipid-binding transport protein (Tim44 family)
MQFTADARNISIAMEYTLSRIIEELSRIIEEAIQRFREQWNLMRPKNDDDPDLAYIAQIMLIIIIVAIIVR